MSDFEGDPSAVNSLFAALSHQSRRRILAFLHRSSVDDSAWIRVEVLAAELTETDASPEHLYHVHLPQLDELGFVEWDRERELVRRGRRFEAVTPLLDRLEQVRDKLPDE